MPIFVSSNALAVLLQFEIEVSTQLGAIRLPLTPPVHLLGKLRSNRSSNHVIPQNTLHWQGAFQSRCVFPPFKSVTDYILVFSPLFVRVFLYLNGGDGLQVAANIFNNQSRTADKEWFFRFRVGRGANNSP
jgi:hypothetical protein